jgi:hypothetical protein
MQCRSPVSDLFTVMSLLQRWLTTGVFCMWGMCRVPIVDNRCVWCVGYGGYVFSFKASYFLDIVREYNYSGDK